MPSLYQAMRFAWAAVCPPGAKGPNTNQLQGLVYTVAHFSLASCRVRSIVHSKRWPCWFKQVWKVLPESYRGAILVDDRQWFDSVIQQISSKSEGAFVYIMFSHSGSYIGKANATRQSKARGAHLGFVERTLEHTAGMVFPQTASGKLPRYKVLRSSMGSFCVMPLQLLGTEVQALACERALIRSTKPMCNGADWAGLLNSKALGAPLAPGKAIRKRPPPALRAPVAVHRSAWEDLSFAKLKEKEMTKQVQAQQRDPRLPFTQLYRFLQNSWAASTGCLGPLCLLGRASYHLFIAFVAESVHFISFQLATLACGPPALWSFRCR